jgi:hypothetical protein
MRASYSTFARITSQADFAGFPRVDAIDFIGKEFTGILGYATMPR